LNAGIPAKIISDMPGHSSTTVTLDLYTAVTDTARSKTARAIARRLAR